MRSILLMLIVLAMPGVARAQWIFSLEPAQGRNGEAINLRVVADEGCFLSSGITSVARNGSAVTATIWMTDAVPPGGCPQEWMTPRLMPLGSFATGNYVVHVIVCVNAPIPCTTEATLPLSVFGSNGQRFTVPTLSGAVIVGLIFALMVLGAARQPRAGG